jgi:2-methylcitrate dehydratase PrpD
MPVQKRSYSLDPFAADYLERRAKRLKRSASSVLSELIAQAAQQEARDRVLDTLGDGVEVSERDVERWLKKLGAI